MVGMLLIKGVDVEEIDCVMFNEILDMLCFKGFVY